MKMFYLFLSVLSMNHSSNPLVFKILDSYFIGNNVVFTGTKQTWIIRNEQDFAKVFHPAALNGQSVEAPDFEHEIVLGVGFKPSNNAYEITIVKIEKTIKLLKVFYAVQLKEKNLSYTRTSLTLVSIPKENIPQNIKFYLLR